MSDMTLLDAMDAALKNIERQTPDEYMDNVAKHRDGAVATALNDLQDAGFTPALPGFPAPTEGNKA